VNAVRPASLSAPPWARIALSMISSGLGSWARAAIPGAPSTTAIPTNRMDLVIDRRLK
jgi:hypothetical protein